MSKCPKIAFTTVASVTDAIIECTVAVIPQTVHYNYETGLPVLFSVLSIGIKVDDLG